MWEPIIDNELLYSQAASKFLGPAVLIQVNTSALLGPSTKPQANGRNKEEEASLFQLISSLTLGGNSRMSTSSAIRSPKSITQIKAAA
jgi:hypothetical protein